MNARTLLRRTALGAAALALLTPLAPSDATTTVTSTGAAGTTGPAARQAGDPPGTVYVYRGSYTAEISHSLSVPWGNNDLEDRAVSVSIRGTIPEVRITGDDIVGLDSTSSTLSVTDAVGSSITRTNFGNYERTCHTTSAKVTGPALVLPYDDGYGKDNTILPFTYLKVPMSCEDSDGKTSTQTYGYGPLKIPMAATGPAGAASMEIPFAAERGLPPLTDPQLCPGYIPGQTDVCLYGIEGTLTLTFVRKILPGQAPQPSTTITPGAKKVRTRVGCPQRCTVTIRVTPLKGGPTIATRKITPRPGRTVTAKIAIPARKRALVKRSGGVRVKLTYRLAGGRKYAETRKARL